MHGMMRFASVPAGPVATGLSRRFSVRKVTFVGGILFGLGITICAFAPSIYYMLFSYSFMTGGFASC
jgi:MFS family permease